MGVEMIKDRLGEDQLVLSNEALYNDNEIGSNLSDFNILKVIKSEKDKYVAKVSSKKNYKIYLMKKIKATPEQINEEFKILKNRNHQNVIKYFKWLEDEGNIYIIKEYVDNGPLMNL